MCLLGWIYELVSNIFVIMAPMIKFQYGWPNTYFLDPVSMFVIIPFLYLFNDDDTKEIIFKENWFQGVKCVLGIYVAPSEEHNGQNLALRTGRNGNPSGNRLPVVDNPPRAPLRFQFSTNNEPPHQQTGFQNRRCMSLVNIVPGSRTINPTVLKYSKKQLSCTNILLNGMELSSELQETTTQTNNKDHTCRESTLSLETLYLR